MLYRHDIAGSIAHAHALHKACVITEDEKVSIVEALKAVAGALGEEKVTLDPKLEDVHMNVEKLLIGRVGDVGAKLHTGRSRNDQVALDVRLWTREALTQVMAEALALQQVLLRRAKDAQDAVMPGYTHLQHAQPVVLSHHLLAHFWRVQRDFCRLLDCYKRTNISPLGAGALAGTSFGLDRSVAAEMLRMDGLTENSLDAVSDRDFAAESAFVLSLMMVHLSSLCEELILWSSSEFGFVRLQKELSSGSSMMPQKRNPDLPELVRGKTGRVLGDLVAFLTLLKSLPLAYNRDLQEDKENLNDVFNTVGASLHALTTFLAGVDFDKVRMRKSAGVGLMTATDLADFLTTLDVPFREAHGLVKDLAERSDGDETKFKELAAQELPKKVEGLKASDIDVLALDRSVERRNVRGGTAREAVEEQMSAAARTIETNKASLEMLKSQVAVVDAILA